MAARSRSPEAGRRGGTRQAEATAVRSQGADGGSRASDPLADYRAKRDFSRSPEPAGDAAPRRAVGPSRAGPLHFVVQKHAATRLHFDLRLELGGVLKSWAVTRGPSLDPADRRLAVEVEDHPLDYRDFEGAIAEGYGAGTVMLWDEGEWEPGPEISDPAEALARGNLKFVLHGERLRGGWDLVRMKPRPKERSPQWLLIKRRDEEARPGEGGALVEEATTSVRTGRTMEAIAAGRAPTKPKPKRASKAASPKTSPAKPPARPAATPSTKPRAGGSGLDPRDQVRRLPDRGRGQRGPGPADDPQRP